MAIDTNQEVQLRAPVASGATFAGHKMAGTFGWDSTSGCFTFCPADGSDYIRLAIHPSDAPLAATLNGADLVTVIQGGVFKRTTVTAIGGGGTWQPLDADLTAIAALVTQAYGRSLLTATDAAAARAILSTPAIADLGGYQPLDSDLTAIAALTTTAFGRAFLTMVDGPATRTAIGAGTSSFSGAYSALSAIPAPIDAIDGLTPAADRLAYYTGASTASLAPITAFARTILDDADAVTVRGTLSVLSSAQVVAGYQPLDPDLTAISALTTQIYGRSLLTAIDASAARALLSVPAIADLGGYQPLDSDLTAIAALVTTAFGRSLLTQADAATARATLGAGTSSFSGAYTSLTSIPAAIDAIDALVPVADKLPYFSGASTASLATLTAFARTLLAGADAAAMRTVLGAPSATHATLHQAGGSDPLAGQSIPGLQTSDSPTFAAVVVNGAAGTSRELVLNTAGVNRWNLRANTAAESGANAGTNLDLIARTDAGASIDLPLTIIRAGSGAITLGGSTARPVVLTGALKLPGISATALAKFDASGNLVVAVGTESVKFSYAEIKATNATLKISCDPTTGQAAIQFGKGSTSTDYRIIQLWQESTDSLDFRSYHTDGGYLYTRLQIPRLSTLPISINHGLDVYTGGLKIGGNFAITAARAFDGTGLKLSGQTSNALAKWDASGNLVSSGLIDNGTYLDASRTLHISSMHVNALGYLGVEKTDGNLWKFKQSLTTDALELYNHTTLATTFSPTGDIVAAGQIASSGMVLRLDTAYPTLFGCIFGDGVTPGANNYSLSISRDNSSTYLNSATKTALSIGGSDRVVAQAAGVQFTGALTQDVDNKPRISSVGAFTGTSLKCSNLSGIGVREVGVDASGNLVVSNATGNAGYGLLLVQSTVAPSSIFAGGSWKGGPTVSPNTLGSGDRVTVKSAWQPDPTNTGSYTATATFGGQTLYTLSTSSLGGRLLVFELVCNGSTLLVSVEDTSGTGATLLNVPFDALVANTFEVLITPGNTSQRFVRYTASLQVS